MNHMWREIFEQPQVLERCITTNRDKVLSLVDKIRHANIQSVVIAARGTSDHSAVYGKYLIEYMLGIPVSLAAPSVITTYHAKMNYKNCLVIGISQSGKALDVLEVIREANRQNAMTVAITNYQDSNLAKEAQVHLYTDAGEEKSVAATKTFSSQLMLLAQLVATWANNNSLSDKLGMVPKKLIEVLDQDKAIRERVQRYRYIDECVVLSRGINYAIALETALKIQETNYVRARGFAVSDFHHGPFAIIEKNMPVILFAPEGPTLTDVLEMIDKLNSVGAELVIISNVDKVLNMGCTSFRIPKEDNDIITPFYNVVIAQMFACELALAKGLDPDKPRGLNKVTITK